MGRRKSGTSSSPHRGDLPPLNPEIDGADDSLTDCEYDDTELMRAHEQSISQFLAQREIARPSSSSLHATRSPRLAPAFEVAPLPSSSKPAVPRKKRKAVHDTEETQRSPKRARKSVGNATPTARAAAKRRRASDPGETPSSSMWSLTVIFTSEYAFVRLDKGGNVIDGSMPVDSTPGYWWPAKIEDDMKDKSLRIFGDDLHGKGRVVHINNPSQNNVLTFYLPSTQTVRFTTKTFTADPALHNLNNRFNQACNLLRDEGAFDDMVFSDDEASTASPPQAQLPPEPTPQVPTPSPSPEPIRAISSPFKYSRGPELTMKIPGELVLSRMKQTKPGGDHWPAKICKWLSPYPRYPEGAYEVLFMDGQVQKLPRAYFHRTFEDGFKTCVVGHMALKKSVLDKQEAATEYDGSSRRSPSPFPEMPTKSESARLPSLSLKHQFMLVTPILLAIVRDEFPPARFRHNAFMKGRKARSDLYQFAGFGDLEEWEHEELLNLLSQFFLGSERWAVRLDMDIIAQEAQPIAGPSTQPSGLASPPPSSQLGTEERVDDSELPATGVNDQTMETEPREPAGSSEAAPTFATPGSPLPSSPEHQMSPAAVALPPSSPPVSILASSQVPLRSTSEPPQASTSALSDSQPVASSSSQPDRIKGCEAYEQLSRVERLQYCTDVLLPEAIIQLLLWRTGKRSESGPLSDVAAEETLHTTGYALATTAPAGPIDGWVDEIMRKRNMYDRRAKPQPKLQAQPESRKVGGKALRYVERPNYKD